MPACFRCEKLEMILFMELAVCLFNTATFYLTLFLQQASIGFMHILVRISDLFNFFFRTRAAEKFYVNISRKPWLKNETDTFDYGYYYAMYSCLINITITFG